MGWPKKDEEVRLYFDKPKGTFLLIFLDPELAGRPGHFFGVSELMSDPDPDNPQIMTGDVSPVYIAKNWLKRAEWTDVSEPWKKPLRHWLDKEPEEYRGLWKVETWSKLQKGKKERDSGQGSLFI